MRMLRYATFYRGLMYGKSLMRHPFKLTVKMFFLSPVDNGLLTLLEIIEGSWRIRSDLQIYFFFQFVSSLIALMLLKTLIKLFSDLLPISLF